MQYLNIPINISLGLIKLRVSSTPKQILGTHLPEPIHTILSKIYTMAACKILHTQESLSQMCPIPRSKNLKIVGKIDFRKRGQ